MPASGLQLGWPQVQKVPIFQVYGTKRKASDNETTYTDSDMSMEEEGAVAKKQCVRPQADQAEINHNNLLAAHNQLQSYQQQQLTSNQWLPHHQEQLSSSLCSQQNTSSQHHNMLPQNDHIMDLCDEVYTHVTPAQTEEEACMAMDSDCVPDQSQYSRSSSSAFCKEFGGSDDLSPSGRIRCYCKPSWEGGMLDMRPYYISDIY